MDKEERYYRVPFKGAPSWGGQEIGEIPLSWEMLGLNLTEDGIEPVYGWAIYPVTIVQARYQGHYEGGRWLCFPVPANALNNEFWRGWQDGDIPCMEWWLQANSEKWPIGRSGTPNDAYLDLIDQVKKMAGVQLTAEEVAALPEAERAEWFYENREQVDKESDNG